VLVVYEENKRNEIACNDDWSGLQSQVSFPAHAGITYWAKL
jgi:hypothetical protein